MKEVFHPQGKTKTIYLDHAATTPIHPLVVEAMSPYMHELYGNPSSLYPMSSRVRSDIESARRSIQTLLGAEEGNLFFTSGGTESNNWAIIGAVRKHKIKHIITSPLEHRAVLMPIIALKTEKIASFSEVALSSEGNISYKSLETMLSERKEKTLVSLMHGNNEIGNLTDIAKVAEICKRHGALFHCDMVQTVGYYPLSLDACGVDFATGSAHKFYGPKGIGFLYVREGVALGPLLHGGQQERGFRAGTENVTGIIGMEKALSWVHKDQKKNRAHIQGLKERMIEGLCRSHAAVTFNGACRNIENSLCSLLNMCVDADKETFLMRMAMKNIAISSGSACMSGGKSSSHVLRALGVGQEQAILRVSFGLQNTTEDIDYVVEVIKEISDKKKD